MNLTKLAHDLIDDHFDISEQEENAKKHQPIGIAIDATCGNGNDSAFLAERANQLLCFDIQSRAITQTQQLLATKQFDCAVECIETSHENLLEQATRRGINNDVDIVMFNLGFLPKSNNLEITTTQNSSVQALKQSMQCLSNRGLISLLCYRGHPGGPEEFDAIKALLEKAKRDDNKTWQVQQFDSAKANDTTPVLLFLTTLASGF